MKIKISYRILTPSKMEINYKGKVLFVSGEATVTPVFYADISSIKKWEPPYEDIPITMVERDLIIKEVTNKSNESKVRVCFE